jgi:hypothetical protein
MGRVKVNWIKKLILLGVGDGFTQNTLDLVFLLFFIDTYNYYKFIKQI